MPITKLDFADLSLFFFFLGPITVASSVTVVAEVTVAVVAVVADVVDVVDVVGSLNASAFVYPGGTNCPR